MLVADGRVLRLSGAASKHGRIGGSLLLLLLLGAPPIPSHNVRCGGALRAKSAEKLGFALSSQGVREREFKGGAPLLVERPG